MLKASALVYSLFISLLLVSLGGAIISLFYINSVNITIWNEREKINRNATSGIVFLQGANDELINKKTIDLYDNGNDHVTLTKKSWGGFEIDISQAFSKYHQSTQIALSGSSMMKDSTLALYLADKDKPLSLCGATYINGNCYIPKAGIKRAYIEGQNFIGSELIHGNTAYSSKYVETPDDSFIKSVYKIQEGELSDSDSLVHTDPSELRNYRNSFLSKTFILHTTSSIKLDTNKFIGNIILISDKQITIGTHAILKDIILCAPKIILENGFSGCLQAIANDSIIVQNEVDLLYPSLLILIQNKKSGTSSAVVLKEKSKLSGGIFAFQPASELNKIIYVNADKDVSITGQLYTNGSVDLKGKVIGSVICNNFLLRTPSSIYENHLLNATIDRKKLPNYFVTGNLFKEPMGKRTIKWLY